MLQDQQVVADSAAFPQVLHGEELICVTQAARNKLAEIVLSAAADGITGVRVFVAGGGCSGLTYGMGLAEAPGRLDATWTSGDLKIFIDAIALSYLEGAEIDYVEEDEPRFLFRNVFARSGGGGACGGCGGGGCGSH